MEGQGAAVVAAGGGQLPVQRLGVDPDAHRGQLQSLAVHAVPHQQVAVQVPIVIVGGAAVVGPAGLQRPADAHKEGGGVVLHIGVLPLLRGQVGVQVLQLLGREEGNIGRQLGQYRQLGEHRAQERLGVRQRPHDGTHRLLQIVGVPVLCPDDLLPVPLVHIGGVEVVQLLVPADGVHVGIKALSLVELVALQGQALPLGQRVDHYGLPLDAPDVEGHRALHTVQVVVDAAGLGHEQGGGHPVQAQGAGQLVLEQPVEKADGLLGLIDGQQGGISLGDAGDMIHKGSLLYQIYWNIIQRFRQIATENSPLSCNCTAVPI